MSITKDDLEAALAANNDVLRSEIRAEMKTNSDELRGEMKANRNELRGEMKANRDEVRAEIATSESRLHAHIDQATQAAAKHWFQHYARVVIESFREQFGALDEKYRDLPKSQVTLRDELDAHVNDTSVHRVPRRKSR